MLGGAGAGAGGGVRREQPAGTGARQPVAPSSPFADEDDDLPF